MTDLELLVQDKYAGDASMVTDEDRGRLASGEPLAYVIGWVPFLGLHIDLSSRPLIPRPETEWWTERLIEHLHKRFADSHFTFLDLCAGSGAIGLAVLSRFPNAHVSFGELVPEHCDQIRKNLELNNLDRTRADIHESDLFNSFPTEAGTPLTFDIIATNPPYIPDSRRTELDVSVTVHEPSEALFAGPEGLDVIAKIAAATSRHLTAGGEVWLEADISNIEQSKALFKAQGAERSVILNDQYGRPRVLVSYFA